MNMTRDRNVLGQYLTAMKAPPAVFRAAGLGSYGENPAINPVPPNTYGNCVFNSPTAGQLQARESPQDPVIIVNMNSFATYPFQTGTAQGAQSLLPDNQRRNFLLVQNQSSSTNLFFNFQQDAGNNQGIMLAPGVAVFFDIVCPRNTVSVFFPNITPQPGLLVEGAA